MKKVSKKSRCFLILLFSFWFMIFPVYLYFSTIDNLDISSLYPCFKNIDEEDSIPSSERTKKIFELTFHIKHILIIIAHPSLARVPNLLRQPALNSKSLILRC